MKTLLKKFVAVLLIVQTIKAPAQNISNVQQAFSDSYTQELAKNYGEAIESLNKIYVSESYELNLRLGWLNYMNKNLKGSQNYYQKAVDLKPASIEAKMGLITCLVSQESWDQVSQLYGDILKIDPENTTASYWQGVIFYNRKKYDVAARLFETVVKFWPFDYDGNHMLAWCYLNVGKIKEAKKHFETALMVRPKDESAQNGLGKIK